LRFTDPFPHVVIDDFIDRDTVRAINAEWPDGWRKEDGKFNRKWSREGGLPAAA
jgi:hypothetical protein